LIAIVLLAATLHGIGIARSILPAQDGLKFLRVARRFQTQPWADVVRGSDQHPLYPALVAITEPVVALFAGHGPNSWRVAAQLVAAAFALALLVPLHGLSRELFNRPIADLATLGFVLLPLPMAVGHDTLSDSLALFAFVMALRLGFAALRSDASKTTCGPSLFPPLQSAPSFFPPLQRGGRGGGPGATVHLVLPGARLRRAALQGFRATPPTPPLQGGERQEEERDVPQARALAPALGCGLAAGMGFLARPEVLVVPIAVIATGVWRSLQRDRRSARFLPARLASLMVVFLAIVGSYALVKGEISEKLALRQSASLNGGTRSVRKAAQWLPLGLDDPRWDFSPKEEPAEVQRRGVAEVVKDLFLQWSDALGGVLAFFAIWGLVRDPFIRRVIAPDAEGPDPDNLGRTLVAAYLVLFSLVLVRHEMKMGYLSSRHVLTLVTASLPWAAAGTYVCAVRLAGKLRWEPRRAKRAGFALVAIVVAMSAVIQCKPRHSSRWGHREAGRWLAANAARGDAVLDTRGWAALVSGRPSYDYWHVRQAFTDSHLAYVVVGDDELRASSRRAATLRAVLAHAARPVAGFPEVLGGTDVGVWVYRYERPASWEALRP
jgi:4-amino-4-deoxy-L-arabinose transferase-like glycosyltransferase